MTAPLELYLSSPALAMLGVAAVLFIIGWTALVRERVSSVNFSFFILSFSAAWWLAALTLVMMSANAHMAEAWSRVVYIGVCAIPAAVLQFTFALTDQLRRRVKLVAAAWCGSAVFVFLFLRSGELITGAYRYPWGFYPRLGNASLTFIAFFVCMLVASVLALRSAGTLQSTLTEQQKKRAASFLTALSVGYIASIDFLPSFGIRIYPVGSIAALASMLLCVRAISRFSFADLTPTYLVDRLIENVQGGVIVVDMRGRVCVANPSAAELLASSTEELVGMQLTDLLDIDELPAHDAVRTGRTRNQTTTWRRRDGWSVDVSFSATLLRDRDQLPIGIIYVLHDLSERRRVERHEFAANHDALTGLPNRAYFARRFDQVAGEISAHGRSAAVLFVDLDGFKEINDQHGHAIGDRLLQLVGARLRNALRDDDVLARHGGDEFVALISLRGAEDGAIVAEKLVRVLRREPFTLDQLTLSVSASVGVAIAGVDALELNELIRVADEAMYRQKRERKEPAPERRPRADSPSAPPYAIESRA